MIFSLRGKLIAKNGLFVVIEIGGIGYEVWGSTNSLLALPELCNEIFLYIHQMIREDSQVLYGFVDEKEKVLFCELIKISGVGGKLALAILSHLTVEQFIESIQLKNLNKLINIPGVGKKTAQRLLVEMQNNFQNKKFKELFVIKNSINNFVVKNHQNIIYNSVLSDVQEALIALGYKPKEAIIAVKNLIDVNVDIIDINNKNKIIEELLKKALKNLSTV